MLRIHVYMYEIKSLNCYSLVVVVVSSNEVISNDSDEKWVENLIIFGRTGHVCLKY